MKKIVSMFLLLAMSVAMWATKTLYLVPNSNWTTDNAKFAVYYFGGTGEAADGWSEFMTAVENETNLYTTTIPDGYPTVIFCRMNPAQADRNWNNKWNQTANITLPTDGKNLFTLADGWDQINGTWSTYGAVEPQPIDTTVTPVDTTVVPQPVAEHYYLVGAFNSWNAEEAIEFANADSMYTLSIAALEGEFKVIDAQDWIHGIYGFYTNDYQMPLGSEYNLLAGNQSENIRLDGAYTNVVLNLTKANDVLTLHFVAGTLVEDTTAQPVDTTVVPQPVEEHYYLVGAFNNWNATEAIEFANADSMYTLSIAALEGEFKVIDAQDWIHGIYGFYTNDYQMPLGSEYNLLAGNQSENIRLDGAYTNVVLNLTKASDVLTLHFVAGTLVQDTVAPQPQPENYYIKNNWNGGEWAWRQMEEVVGMSDDTIVTFWGYTDVFGGVGVNISVSGNDDAPMDWYAINDFIIADGDLVPQAMDSVSFIYDAVNHHVHAFVINRPGDQPVDPQPVAEHYYLVGAFNNWNATEAIEFQNADSLYTLSIAALEGEFKVIDAQDWIHGIYGFYTNDYQMPLGSEYNLLAGNQSENIQLDGAYTNVVLNLTKANDVLTLHFVAGTLVEDTTAQPVDTTVVPAANYYIKNNWNGGEWAWQQMTPANEGLYGFLGVFGGTGVNINTAATDEGSIWFSVDDFFYPAELTDYVAQAGDTILFVYNPTDTILIADFVGRPEAVVTPKFYITGNAALVGQDLEWNPAAIPSMTESYTLNLLADIDYVLKVTLNGTWVGENNVKGYNELTYVTPGLQNIGNDHNIGFKLAADGEVTVIYNDSTFEVLGNFVTDDPQPVEEHYYLIGSYNEWVVETALEFTNNDSLFTITIDSLFGEFKVMTARDWSQLSYGRGDNDGVVALGEPYTMVAWAGPNMSVAQAYTNAVLNITKDGDNVLLTLVSGTPVTPEPQATHYYLIGSYNEWDVPTAQEFTPGNGVYTITIDTLFGEFKVMTAHDWSELSYGRGNDDGVLEMGVAYTMVAWASENMSIVGTYANAVLNLQVANNVATLTFVSGTPEVGPQPVADYYIKNNWNGGEWVWQQMIPADDQTYGYIGVFGGTGVNVNTAASDEGAFWFTIADFEYTVLGYEAQAGDTIQFVFNPADTTLTAILVGRPTVEPVEMVEIRLVPGVWNLDGAKFAAVTWKLGETMEENGIFSEWMVGTDTVEALIPADADSIAFGRFNPESGVEPNMMYLWNHTDKLLIDSTMIYTITGWAPAGQDCDPGYWGYDGPSALEVIFTENEETMKALENGVLYIYHNGLKYNVQGQIVR